MAEKELSILVKAKNAANAARDIGKVDKAVSRLGVSAGRGIGNFTKNTEKALGHFKGQVAGLAGSLAPLGAVGGAFALGAGFTAAVDQAKSFQEQMELIQTQAGATSAEVDTMSTSLLGLARSVGSTPEDLAMGLYHVESAGLRGAKALDVLKVAAEGAKVGNSSLEDTTNALVAANQSGVKGVQSMTGAMGTLNAIVGAGNMRMTDLVDAFTTGVLSSAKNFGVSIQSLGAALADMTDQGIPAVDAATKLGSAMRLMAAPTSKAVGLFKSIGLSHFKLAKDLRSPGGILTAITDLKTHMDKAKLSTTEQANLLAQAFGGKQSGAILALTGNLDLLRQKIDAVAKGATGFGDAWAKTQETAQFKWDRFNASLSSAAIKIGNVALPAITDALDGIGGWVDSHGDDLAAAFKSALEAAKGFAAAAMSVGSAAKAMWDTIPAPFRDLLLKGFVADRTIHFLFGISPIQFAAGALTKGLGGILGGLAQRGSSPANPVFVSGAGIGGVGSAIGEAAGAAGGLGISGIASIAALAAVPLIPLVAAYFLAGGEKGITASDYKGRQATAAARGLNPANVPTVTRPGMQSPIAQWAASAKNLGGDIEKLRGTIAAGLHGLAPKTPRQASNILKAAASRDKETSGAIKAEVLKSSVKQGVGPDMEALRGKVADQLTAARQGASQTATAATSAGHTAANAAMAGASLVAAAVRASQPSFAISVAVSGAAVQHSVSVSERTGPRGSDRNSSARQNESFG